MPSAYLGWRFSVRSREQGSSSVLLLVFESLCLPSTMSAHAMNWASSNWTLALTLGDVCCKAIVRELGTKKSQQFWSRKEKGFGENSIKVINFLLLKVKNIQHAEILFIILQMNANSHLFLCCCHVSAWGIYIWSLFSNGLN